MSTTIQQDLAAGERALGVRYYYLFDVGTQWQTKLARLEIETTYESQKKGPDERKETVVNADLLDIPTRVTNSDFVRNVFGRQDVPYMNLAGNLWGGWSLSPAEYNRIKRMIELTPAVGEFEKLARYE